MADIIKIDEHRPHVCITGQSETEYVMPVSLFNDVIEGRMEITDIENYEDILPVILREWLDEF